MGNKLKAISKVSVALALLGATVPAAEAAPIAMAAKKATKKAKKSTKKVVKKSTKKAKKAKKATKKKATKKVAKKTAAKKPAKKSVKKTTKKSVKKAVKKPVAKKTVKKAVKKPVSKKPATKVVKKTTTKKPANKAVKHVTMADKYQPKVKSGTVNIDWGTSFYDSDYVNYSPVDDVITNKSSLPADVDFVYLDPVNTRKAGTYKTRIQAKYKDGSKEVVGTVTFVVSKSDAEKYQPTVQDVTLNWGESFNPRKDAITNAPGYFPMDPALPQFNDPDTGWGVGNDPFDPFLHPGEVYFGYVIDGLAGDEDEEEFIYKHGTYNAQIRVNYPDGSSEDTNKFKITVLPSDADKAKLSLKSSDFTVSSGEAWEHKTDNGDYTLNDPTRFLNIDSALPKGTTFRFDDSELDSVDAPGPDLSFDGSLYVHFPDGSVYSTDSFGIDFK